MTRWLPTLLLAACADAVPAAAPVDGERVCVPADDSPLPAYLSESGRFDADVMPYSPLSPLWSDGATKERFVRLPCDAVIDTSDEESWELPIGTTLWKEFTVGGRPVETRTAKRTGQGPTGWDLVAYRWDEAGLDADLAPDGAVVEGLPGRADAWSVPSRADCETCHANLPGHVIGFDALQLAHDGPGLTLARLAGGGWLSEEPTRLRAPVLDWEPTARDAALALHGSCGHCHGVGGMGTEATSIPGPGLAIRLRLSDETPSDWDFVRTAAGVALTTPFDEAALRVDPGSPDTSGLLLRMEDRGGWLQMPPLATTVVDASAVERVTAFVRSL